MSELRTNKILPRDGLPAGSFGGGIVQVRFAALDSSTSISATTADLFTLNIIFKKAFVQFFFLLICSHPIEF